MDELVKLTMAYDIYGTLLNSRHRAIFEMYYMENLSLVEIAEIRRSSRQSVFELVTRIKAKLLDYEKKIGYIAFYEEHKKMCERVLEEPEISDEVRAMLSKSGFSGS